MLQHEKNAFFFAKRHFFDVKFLKTEFRYTEKYFELL